MPFILVAIGIILIIAAINDKVGTLASQVATDVTTKQGGVSFAAWFAAIVVIGVIGYVPGLQGVSRALLGLVVVVIVLKGGTGFFSKFTQAIENPPAPSTGAQVGNSVSSISSILSSAAPASFFSDPVAALTSGF